MLSLERKVGEEVVINEDIEVEVLEFNGSRAILTISSKYRLFTVDQDDVLRCCEVYEAYMQIGETIILTINIATNVTVAIEIKLTKIKKNKIWLGFNAPRSVIINRKERNGQSVG